jgi:hypothetical protein
LGKIKAPHLLIVCKALGILLLDVDDRAVGSALVAELEVLLVLWYRLLVWLLLGALDDHFDTATEIEIYFCTKGHDKQLVFGDRCMPR